MADHEDSRRERLKRAAGQGHDSALEADRKAATAAEARARATIGKRTLTDSYGAGVAPAHGSVGVGKSTLAESWGAAAVPLGQNAVVCSVAVDAARRHLAALTASQQAGGHDAASDAAHQLRLALQTARDFATDEQRAALAELEAEAARGLAAASTPSRDANAKTPPGQGRDLRASDVTAREQAWTAAAAPLAAQLGVDALIRVDDAAASHGARGLAHAGVVHLAPTLAPDHADARHILAHELVHVAQSRLPVAGTLADAEREADELAAGLVRGELLHRPRIGIAASVAAADTGAKAARAMEPTSAAPLAAAKSDVAFAYLRANLPAFTEAWTKRLAGIALPPNPRIAWAPFGIVTAFADALAGALGADPLFLRLPELMYPVSPWAVIDQNRALDSGTPGVSWGGRDPAGPLAWNPMAGEALAIELVARVAESTAHLVPRYVVQLDAKHPAPVTVADLVTSQPLDRVTARLLCDARVLAPVAPKHGAKATHTAAPGAFRDGIRFLQNYRWLGQTDPKLWNWIEVTEPSDATAEEVAATLWLDAEQSQRAYIITASAPLFRVEPGHARVLLGDLAPAPTGLDDPHADNALDVAASGFATDVAIAQTAGERKLDKHGVPVPPDVHRLAAQLDLGWRQLERVRDLLVPWHLSELIVPALHWVSSYREHLLAIPEARLIALAPVIDGQQAILFEAVGAVQELVDTLGGRSTSAGVEGPLTALRRSLTAAVGAAQDPIDTSGQVTPTDGPEGPITSVLRRYATAIGESHLCEPARVELAGARKAKGGLALALMDGSLHASYEATRDLKANEGALHFDGAASEADYATYQRQLVDLRGKYAEGAPIDGGDVALLAANLKEHAFDARAKTLYLQLHNLSEAIREAMFGGVETLASLFSGELRELPVQILPMLSELEDSVIAAHGKDKAERMGALGPQPTKAALAAVTNEATLRAEQRYADLTKAHALDTLIPRAIELMQHQHVRTAVFQIVIQVAVLIGVSILGGVAGNLVAGAVRGTLLADAATASIGMLRGARVAEIGSTVLGIATDASINTLGQMAMTGGDFKDGFFENFATNAALRVLLAPLHSVAEAWGSAGREVENASLWERSLGKTKLVLREGAVLTAEMITGAAVDYVVKRSLSDGPPPDEGTALDWAVQGASMAAGKFFGHKLAAFEHDMVQLAEQGAHLRARAARLKTVADRAARTGDREAALQVFVEHHELMVEEAKVLEELGSNPKTKLPAQTIETLRTGNRAELTGVKDKAYAALPLRFAGLTPDDASGKVWAGATEDIAIALHQASRCGMRVEVVDHDVAARTWKVWFNEEQITIIETELRGRPRASKANITDADRQHARRYAKAADFMQAEWEAKTKREIDGLAAPSFDLIQIGGAGAGVTNQSTLPATGDGLGSKLTVYDHAGTLSNRGSQDLGQPPEKWDAPGMRASEQAGKDDKWLKSDDLDRALGVGRLEVQTPAYRGRVVDTIERRGSIADAKAWLDPKRAFRILVDGGSARYFYADRIDYAGGPGASDLRQIHAATDAHELETMFEDNRVLRAEDPAYAKKVLGGEILVWGGTATGAWAAEAARRTPDASVTVMGDSRPARTDWPRLVEDYEGVMSEIAARGSGSVPPELASRKAALETEIAKAHGGMSIARNRKPGATYEHGIHGDPAHGLRIEFGTPSKISPTADGRVMVTMGHGADATTKLYDQVVIAHGLDPATPGGPGALLGAGAEKNPQTQALDEVPAGTIALRPVFGPHKDGDAPEVLALESIDPPGIRLTGAAYANKKMSAWVKASERAAFEAAVDRMADAHAMTRDYGEVSSDSTTVTTGTEVQRDRIPRSNEVLAAQAYRLPGHDHVLELDKADPSKWDDQVREFFTLELRARGEWVRVERLGGGRSGAVVYNVWVGDNDVGIFKIFRSVADAEMEAKMLDKLKAAHLKKLKPVRERGVVGVDDGKGSGALLMDAAKGKSVAQMIETLPNDPAERQKSFARLEIAVQQVAEGLAEMHARFETHQGGTVAMMTKEAKLSDANYMLDRSFRAGADVAAVRAALGERDFDSVKEKLEGPMLQAFLDAKVPATNYHGDANAGNFILSGTDEDGRFAEVAVIDLDKMRYSIEEGTQAATRTGAADVARFLGSLETLQPGALSPVEVTVLRKAFSRQYSAQYLVTAGHDLDTSQYAKAESWYRAELEVGRLKSDAHAKARLMKLLELEVTQ